MIICPRCFNVNNKKNVECFYCKTSIENISDVENNENISLWHRKRRIKHHTFSGPVLCFSLTFLLTFPLSLYPDQLFKNILLSLIFGIPLGYFVAKFSQNMWSAALIGTVVGSISFGILLLFYIHDLTVPIVFYSFTICLMPGPIMGVIVGLDDYS